MLYAKDRSAAPNQEGSSRLRGGSAASFSSLKKLAIPNLEALMREAMRWVRTNVGNQTVLERLNRWRFASVDWNMP
jgi:hypothetical protein